MSTPPASRTSLIALSAALGAAIVAIAFLLGRESMRAPEAASETRAVGTPVPATQSDVTDEKQAPRQWPAWADLEEWNGVDEPAVVDASAARIEQRPDGTVLLSNRSNAEATAQATGKSPSDYGGSAVAAYFLRIDTIHSQSGAGDPNTFAMGLIKAGLGGSTAGFDELLRDTQRMDEEIRRVTPPPSCKGYHEESLAVLAESRELLEELKAAFEERDFSRLTMIAQEASELQTKANALQEMRERIVGLAAVR